MCREPASTHETEEGESMGSDLKTARALGLEVPIWQRTFRPATTTELAYRPCHKPVCRFGHHRCMGDIDVERVTLATRSALANSAAAEKLNAV